MQEKVKSQPEGISKGFNGGHLNVTKLSKLPFVKEALMAVFLIGGSNALARCGMVEITPGQRLQCPYGQQTCDGGDTGDDASPDRFDAGDAGDGGDIADARDGGDIIEPVLCENNDDCRDNNKCTTERCDSQNPQADEKGCVMEAVLINDGIACTVDSCDPEEGVKHDPDNRVCNDNNPCTIDSCGRTVGCHYETSVNGAPCDLLPNIDNEECFEGNCSPPCTRQSGCNDGKSCTSEYCYVNSGRCLYDPRHSRCDDQNICNGPETCSPNIPEANPLTGCAPALETPVCDDNNPCNGQETCDPAIGCVTGTPVNCSHLNRDCVEGVCNPASAVCETQQKPNGTECEDGRSCTVEDSCRDGACVSGGTINCNDRIQCTIDACSEERQRCIHTPDNSRCDNNLFCDGQEICDTTRGCVADTTPDCQGNQCNAGSCNEDSNSCELTPVTNCAGEITVACPGPDREAHFGILDEDDVVVRDITYCNNTQTAEVIHNISIEIRERLFVWTTRAGGEGDKLDAILRINGPIEPYEVRGRSIQAIPYTVSDDYTDNFNEGERTLEILEPNPPSSQEFRIPTNPAESEIGIFTVRIINH